MPPLGMLHGAASPPQGMKDLQLPDLHGGPSTMWERSDCAELQPSAICCWLVADVIIADVFSEAAAPAGIGGE